MAMTVGLETLSQLEGCMSIMGTLNTGKGGSRQSVMAGVVGALAFTSTGVTHKTPALAEECLGSQQGWPKVWQRHVGPHSDSPGCCTNAVALIYLLFPKEDNYVVWGQGSNRMSSYVAIYTAMLGDIFYDLNISLAPTCICAKGLVPKILR